MLHVVKTAPGNQPLRRRSDSRFAIDGLTLYAQDWELKDWMGVKHGPLFKCTTAWIRARSTETTLQWVKRHAGIEGNEGADRLAAKGSQKNPDREDIDLRIPADKMVTGTALARTGQSLIYHHLANAGDVDRLATRRSIKKVKLAVREIFGDSDGRGDMEEYTPQGHN